MGEVSNGRYIDILLVEHHPEESRRIEQMLEAAENNPYRLQKTTSVQAALQLLTSDYTPQIVLLDFDLPDSEGLKTIRHFHLAHPWLPIIVLTDTADQQIATDAAAIGAHDFVVKKDLSSADLRRVLRYTLERRFNEEQLREGQAVYRRQAQELDLLNRVISAASASDSEQSILNDSCQEMFRYFNALRVFILLCSQANSTATVWAEEHHPGLPPLANRQLDLTSEPAFTAVSSMHQTLILPALSQNLAQILETTQQSKLMIHVLQLAGEAIGFIVLNLPNTHPLSTSNTRLISMVAEEIGLALEKIRLHGRLQAYANELETRVAERTQALAEANEQLKSLDQLKTKFVSDVSHELRNPITNLSLYLELLEYSPPDRQAKYFSTLRTQIRRLSNLVEEILTLSRLENNNYRKLYRPFDLNFLIQQAVVAHTPRAQSKQIKLHFEPRTPLPAAWGEPNQITQIVTNLLDNALNYTSQGSITISTDFRENGANTEIIMHVIDSGMGISKDDLPHIFERFYRGAQVDKDHIMGTGLGLGIVKEIVTRHNGRIEVTHTSSEGSCFTVTLPTTPSE